MNTKITILIAGLMLLLISFKPVRQTEIGVWANKDCELIRTENFVLYFERSGNQISATIQRIEKSSDKFVCKLIGKTIFKDSIVSYKYLNLKLDSLIDPKSIGEVQPNGQLKINANGEQQTLHLIEKINIVASYDMSEVDKDKVGLCLQQWRLGTRLTLDYDQNSISFEAGTNKHNYCFVIQPGFIYCRAAQIRSNNNGTYFAQNIRLMSNSNESTRYMTKDNRKLSSTDLIIDNSKFDSTKCVFDRNGIYWSMIKFDKDAIFLNGCGGDTYTVVKEKKTSKVITDWIEFIKY